MMKLWGKWREEKNSSMTGEFTTKGTFVKIKLKMTGITKNC